MPDLKFGGVNLPCNVEKPSSLSRPKRKIQAVSVPGRSGDIVLMEDAWENYTQTYSINFSDDNLTVAQSADDLVKKLFLDGYQKLEDSFEPDVFRWAYFEGPVNIENLLKVAGRATISFNCKPFRYLTTGDTAVTVTTGDTITNPEAFIAKPLIYVTGSGNGTITMNGKTLTVTGMTDYLYLDCEDQNCYRQAAENRNNLVSGNYPYLKSGNNTVTFTGFTSVKITPRWRRL